MCVVLLVLLVLRLTIQAMKHAFQCHRFGNKVHVKDSSILYYSTPREESFTIPLRERNPLLFHSISHVAVQAVGCEFEANAQVSKAPQGNERGAMGSKNPRCTLEPLFFSAQHGSKSPGFVLSPLCPYATASLGVAYQACGLLSIYLSISLSLYIYIYIYTYCVYIYIYMYIYIYIYMYIHVHMT